MARGLLAAFFVLACVGAAIAESGDFCEFDCVKAIYAENCGGAVCVAGITNDAERDGLCSEQCGSALGGDAMIACLSSMEERGDWASVQTMIMTIRGQICSPFEAPETEFPAFSQSDSSTEEPETEVVTEEEASAPEVFEDFEDTTAEVPETEVVVEEPVVLAQEPEATPVEPLVFTGESTAEAPETVEAVVEETAAETPETVEIVVEDSADVPSDGEETLVAGSRRLLRMA